MAAPDLSHVTTALDTARTSVASAKEKTGEEAHPHLDEVDQQLEQAQNRVNEALEQAGERRGGPQA